MMPDFSGLAYLAAIGIAGIALAPYFVIAAFFGGGSLWAIIPGTIWAAPFAIFPAYWFIRAKMEDRR
jgi:hypothetical protein